MLEVKYTLGTVNCIYYMCLPYTLILLQDSVIYSKNNLDRCPCTYQTEGFRIQSSKNKFPDFPSTFFLESTLNSYAMCIKKERFRRKMRKSSRITAVGKKKETSDSSIV